MGAASASLRRVLLDLVCRHAVAQIERLADIGVAVVSVLRLLVLESLAVSLVRVVLVIGHLGHHLANVAQIALRKGFSVVDELGIHIRQSVRVALTLDEVVLPECRLVLVALTVVAGLQDDVAWLVVGQAASVPFLHVVRMSELLAWFFDFSDLVLPEVAQDVQRHDVRRLANTQLLGVGVPHDLGCLPVLLLVARAPLLNVQGAVDPVE